jgi:hypothetical protein
MQRGAEEVPAVLLAGPLQAEKVSIHQGVIKVAALVKNGLEGLVNSRSHCGGLLTAFHQT